MSEVSLKCFTVAELKLWLLHNAFVDGLSDEVIAPVRAYSIINNPYVKDDMPVVSALYEDGGLAAYTAAFPEMVVKPEGRMIWWFTTLYCKPMFAGKGYGIVVVGNLCETIGEGLCYDMNGEPETVEIFRFLGFGTVCVDRYVLSDKYINGKTLMGRMALLRQTIGRWQAKGVRNKLKEQIRDANYSIRYVSFIDDATYKFIEDNAAGDLMLRSKETFNWILSYPFMIESPLSGRVEYACAFSSFVPDYSIKAVQVLSGGVLVGFYILRECDSIVGVKYLYYAKESEQTVFLSIAEHIMKMNPKRVVTLNRCLADYLMQYGLFPRMYVEHQSFSYQPEFKYNPSLSIQGGDGDTFV